MTIEPDGRVLSLERYRAYLHVLARAHLNAGRDGRVDPSDVVQQTLLQAHRKRKQFRGESDAQLRGWLRRILANVIADAFRGLAREPVIRQHLDESASRLDTFAPAVSRDPIENLRDEERLVRLSEGLAKLSDDERTAVELRHLHNPPWTLADIAKRLNRPTPKSVAGLLARGLAKLRKTLRKESEELL